jgi:hypothetical protein
MRPNVKIWTNQRVVILDWDGNYVGIGFIAGAEYIEGENGWFSSAILLTLDGRRLEGWKHMIQPYCVHLQLEHKPMLLEYHDAS